MSPANERPVLLPTPAHRDQSQPAPCEDPLLSKLQRQYLDLPPKSDVRYKTRQGQDFLSTLRLARKSGFTRGRLATLLQVTPHGIDKMLKQPMRARRTLRRWPGPEDVRALRLAWEVKDGRKRIGRDDPVFVEIHLALQELLICGYEIHEIALALGAHVRELQRFAEEPLDDPATLARKIRNFRREA